MNYAVDINKVSIKQAIKELGINLDSLLIKELEDFQDLDESSNISRLKYDYFNRKQQEFIRLITEKVKQYSTKFRKSSNQKPSVFLTQVSIGQSRPSSQDSRYYEMTKKKILKSLNDIRKNLEVSEEIDKRIENSRENKQKLLSVKNTRKIMMEKYREKQVENLSRIRRIQAQSLKKYRYELSTPKMKTNQSIEFYSKDEIKLPSEPNVEEQLKIIEEKLKRSEALKCFYIKQKKSNISKFIEKETSRLKPKDCHSDSEKLIKLIEKQKILKERHESLLSTKQSYNENFRNKLQKKLEDAQKKFKEIQSNTVQDKKAKVKMVKSELVLKKNHEDWVKKLELKTEISRFKEEAIQSEQERYLNIK